MGGGGKGNGRAQPRAGRVFPQQGRFRALPIRPRPLPCPRGRATGERAPVAAAELRPQPRPCGARGARGARGGPGHRSACVVPLPVPHAGPRACPRPCPCRHQPQPSPLPGPPTLALFRLFLACPAGRRHAGTHARLLRGGREQPLACQRRVWQYTFSYQLQCQFQCQRQRQRQHEWGQRQQGPRGPECLGGACLRGVGAPGRREPGAPLSGPLSSPYLTPNEWPP